jgi:hypothetical protein
MAPDEPLPNGESQQDEAPRTLREVAEQTWNDLETSDDGPDSKPARVDDGGQPRDQRGRWQSKDGQPGEAAGQDGQPSPDDKSGTQPPERPTQPPPDEGRSSEAPANWSAEDRQNFERLPDEAKAFLLRRHGEMEGEFQRRVQAVGEAAKFTEAVGREFRDPVIAASLQQTGISPYEAIQQWAGMHKRAYSPNPQERVAVLFDIARNIGLDPAAVFRTPSPPGNGGQPGQPQGLTEDDLKDPAIRFFADHLTKIGNEIQANRTALQGIHQEREQRALSEARWTIDQFADEKGPDGKPLRPHFDAVLQEVIGLYHANPQLTLQQCYDRAVRLNDTTFNGLLAAERNKIQQQQDVARAQRAARGNTRGVTTPVAKAQTNGGERKGLRGILEDSADEVGF